MSSTSPTSTTRSALPRPTGTHSIGRISTDCEDPDRADPYAPDPSTARQLVLWVWYPADPRSAGPPADFLPQAWTPIAEQLGVEVTGVGTHAVVDAPAADRRSPVLLLSPSGFSPLFLASIAEELASHGYVVVGVNHTFEAAVTVFGNGRVAVANPDALGGALGPHTGPHEAAFRRRAEVCNYKAADLRFVADHLHRLGPNAAGLSAGHLDFTSLGALGHSFGGNAALEWCRADARCRASANLDGAIWTEVGTVGLPRPALQLLADHPEFALTGADAVAAGIATDPLWHDAERSLTRDRWRDLDRLATPGHTARIAGSTHMSFMDIPFLPVQPASPIAGMLAATTIRPERMWRLTCDLLLGFFAEYLDGFTDPVDGFPGTDQPEVSLGPP
jgi:dienelactone hydrolase